MLMGAPYFTETSIAGSCLMLQAEANCTTSTATLQQPYSRPSARCGSPRRNDTPPNGGRGISTKKKKKRLAVTVTVNG